MKAVLLLCFVAAASAQYMQYPFFYNHQSYLPIHSNVKYHANSAGVQHTVYQKREAEAEPQYYSSLGYSSLGYNNLGYSSVYSPYTTYGFNSHVSKPLYYSHLGKREAEAEPQYYSSLGYGHHGYSSIYSPRTFGYSSYISKPYYSHLGKREAEAEPQYYSNLGYSSLGYSSVYSPYAMYGYNSHISKPMYYSHLGKREAEAEPQYYSNLGYSHLGYSSIYSPRTFGYNSYISKPYYSHLGKREAEAEPQYFQHHGIQHTPYVFNPYFYKTPIHHQTMTYSNDAVKPFNYAAKGQYKAVTAGSMHVAKREADPAYFYNGYTSPVTSYTSAYMPIHQKSFGTYVPHSRAPGHGTYYY